MTKKTNALIILAVVASAQLAFAQAQNSARMFGAEDVFDLEFANDPRISPDGTQIVYERRSYDIMKDNSLSNLWLVAADGSLHRPLVSGTDNASGPRWSPDGDRIVYSQATSSGTGVMLRWMDSGQTALLANLQHAAEHITWSPDGRWLAFVAAVPAKTRPIATPRQKPDGAEWSDPVKVIDTAQYRRDGAGFLETAYQHVFVLPADGGTPRQLTSGEFNHAGSLAWTADGEGVLFSANRNDGWELAAGESDLYRVSLSDGVLTQLTDRGGAEHSPAVSPDGRRIAYIHDSDEKVSYTNSVLHVLSANGDEDGVLTADLDSSVNDVQWSGNRHVYFTYDRRAVRKVARVTVGGEFEDIVSGLGSTSLGRPYLSGSYTVAANGAVVFTKGDAHNPADVAIAGRRAERKLTSLNDDLLRNMTLGAVHEITYASSYDGQQIQGWFITPPDYDPGKKYPLILEIHGGPHLAYGAYFSAEMQMMASAGYVVFYDNHRGSTSYGEKFAMLLHYKYSSPDDFADHMSGVDALIEKGVVDPQNLFITGGSAGGIASAYAIGLTDRFNAAAVAKPVVNWISKALTADSYIGQIHFQFPGKPWEEFEHYWRRSPLSLVGNMTTPTMLITGEEDYRTPISETEQMYQALKLKGVDVVMVRVPGSSHGIAGRPSRLVAKVDNILAWFRRYRTDLEGENIDEE